MSISFHFFFMLLPKIKTCLIYIYGQKSIKGAIVIHADERARSASSQLFWCGALQKLASLYSRCTHMKELYCSARTPCMLYNNIRSDRLRPLRGTQDLKRSLL